MSNWYKISSGRLFNKINNLKPQFAMAAQKVYNEWNQDENGIDEELGSGGICQDIAEEIADVLFRNRVDASTIEAQCGEQHVWVLCYDKREAYHIDIRPSVYETGGGYNWKKIPEVVFDASHIEIYPADKETADYYRQGDF